MTETTETHPFAMPPTNGKKRWCSRHRNVEAVGLITVRKGGRVQSTRPACQQCLDQAQPQQ